MRILLCAKITDIVSSIDFWPLCGTTRRTHAFKLTMQTENVDNKHFSSCARVVLSVAFSVPIPVAIPSPLVVAVVRVVVAVGR